MALHGFTLIQNRNGNLNLNSSNKCNDEINKQAINNLNNDNNLRRSERIKALSKIKNHNVIDSSININIIMDKHVTNSDSVISKHHEASRTSIISIVGIQNCFITENKEFRSKIKTDSNDIEYISSTKDENINVLVTYYQIFDLRRIYTNSIHRMVQIFANNDRLKNNILTYINRFIETFYENVYMKIHLQDEFAVLLCADHQKNTY
ncbi:unnamed protein product, partial [Rotaria magnacalcarata]